MLWIPGAKSIHLPATQLFVPEPPKVALADLQDLTREVDAMHEFHMRVGSTSWAFASSGPIPEDVQLALRKQGKKLVEGTMTSEDFMRFEARPIRRR